MTRERDTATLGLAGLDRKLEIVNRLICDLTPNPKNARKHDARQLRMLETSIRSFGFLVPALIDDNDCLLTGHARLIAAKRVGLAEVPTIRIQHLSKAQARAFAIADNRLTEIAAWDDHLLAEELKELSGMDLEFSLDATGFTTGEIDFRIEGAASNLEREDPADVPPPLGPPVSRAGDLWLLGPHRVLCGNALDEAAHVTLMGGAQAAMVFTDPPFNVPIEGHVSGNGHVTHREFVMASGEMSEAEFTRFLATSLGLHARHSAQGSLHYWCMDWRHLDEILAAGRVTHSELKNLCVWVKTNAGMGSFYRSQHELILVFKNGSAKFRNNIELGRFGRNRTNVWTYPGATGFARNGEEGNLLALHPTVKPVALVADAIMDSTCRGEIVLDGFLGSGTTIIAAERTGRRGFGLELDPHYCDVIVRRWQAFTGQQARLAAGGMSFEEVATERVRA